MEHLKKYSWIYVFAIALIIGILLRIILPWNTVFTENGVVLQGVDCYYYMHLADLISQNNMQIPKFDPYYDFPNGLDYTQLSSTYNAYGYFIALITWIFTFGNPTKSSLDFIGAIHPAILGILSLIPIFVITYKLTNNKLVSSIAMVIGSVIPGEFFARSILGASDTHCLEIFLFSYAIMFSLLAITKTNPKYIHIAFASIFLSLYLILWQGAIIALLVLSVFGIFKLIIDKLKGNIDYAVSNSIIFILSVSALSFLIVNNFIFSNALLAIIPLLALLVIYVYTVSLKNSNKWIYLTPIVLSVLILLGMVISIKFVGFNFYPSWFTSAARQALNLIQWHSQSTTSEELPLFITLGTVTPEISYMYFGICWYLFFIGMGYLCYEFVKRKNINILFLLVWSITILVPTLAMRRFAYYLSFNVVIVSTYLLWQLYQYLTFSGKQLKIGDNNEPK